MPVGEDSIRPFYSTEGRTHPNRKRRAFTGFEGNNYPSTRTFYSDISTDAVFIAKKLYFYVKLLGCLDARYLESLSRKHGCYLSNYTIAGLLNQKWGVRHNPTENTKLSAGRLTLVLESKAKTLGIWKPFKFSYHKHHIQHENEIRKVQTRNWRLEEERETRRKKSLSRSHQWRDESVPERS